MKKKVLNVATVFSGIGAFEWALKRLHIPNKIIFACDNGERDIEYDDNLIEQVRGLGSIDEKHEFVEKLYSSKTRKTNFVMKSYLHNHKCPRNRFFQDIKLLDGNDFRGQVDIFVGGSPCQSFSSIGNQGGLEDARGTLFYEFARLVQEIQPKVFIYENVRNLYNHDEGRTWDIITRIFDGLHYNYHFEILNAEDFGIPQKRRRVFVVGFRDENNFSMPTGFPLIYNMRQFLETSCKLGDFKYNKKGKLVLTNSPGKIDSKYILSPLLYKYVMKSGTKNFYQKPEINLTVARTILKTMGNRHRAGVDNYVSEDMTSNLGSVRMLTEREAHRLMGFTDDYEIIVSKTQAYKQAGNSIVVDVLMAIIEKIMQEDVF